MKVSIDTNVFIAIKNGEETAPDCEKIIQAIERHELDASISTIAIAEMLVGYYQNGDEQEAEAFLKKTQNNYQIIFISVDIAQSAARIRAQQKIKLPDAMIYASAIANNADYLISQDHPLLKREKNVVSPEEFIHKIFQRNLASEK